jgi:PAS domain S-box-containing protein
VEKVSDETRTLRRAMRDLVALTALPAVWAGYRPPQVAEGLADALLATLRLDLVYLRLPGQAEGQEIEVARTAGRPATPDQTRDMGRALAPWLDGGSADPAPSIPNPAGGGTARLVVVPIAYDRQGGVLVAGSRQTGFPSEEDRLLLGVSANQAAAVLQRQRAEEALRESEGRFRTLAEALPHMVWTSEPDGALDYVNARTTEYTGLTPEQLCRDWRSAVHPEDLPRCIELWTRSLATGEPYDIEHRLRRADGAFRWHLARSLALRDGSGRITKWFGSCTDIDDQKRAEVALREAKEAAESANRAKDEFLANVSHEIRTPMNAILGMAELALDTPLTDDQRQCLKTVKAAADNLLGIINDLLDFSKIEAGKLGLDPADFSLRAAVRDTLRALATRAHKKGLELACNVQPDVPDALVGDAGRLRQVLLNLVGNAIKFTDEGEVVVRVEVAAAPAPEGEVGLYFTVRDTGIGISPDKQERIFRAFEQEDTSTTRRYGGTGLGLTIAARLVALMGGSITVQSEPGRGSTFAFTARFGRQPHPTEQSPARPPVLLRDLRVLVVDDNATNRRILEGWLRGWQMKPVAVGDGLGALGALWDAVSAGRPYPLVLLDARMPDTDGLALAARIRERAALSAIRIILLTSEHRPGDSARSRELRIDAHLLKPVQQDELLETIYWVMSRAQGDPPTAVEEPARESGPVPVPAAAPLHILLAEDNEFSAQLMEKLLARRGHRVRLASNGREALALAGQGAFDLMLLDVHMPELDGFEVVRGVRERERVAGGHLPVIALTARSRQEDRARCLAAGVDDFLTKPVSAAVLLAAIDRLVPAPSPLPLSPAGERGRGEGAQAGAGEHIGLLDPVAVLTACGADAEALRGMCRAFQTYLPVWVAEVGDALRARDAPRLREAAHKLCALLFAFSTTAGNVASDLEGHAAQGRLAQARPLVERLEAMAQELLPLVGGLSLETLRHQTGHN